MIAAGLLLAAVGFGMLTQIDETSGLALAVSGSVVFALGVAPVILATDLVVSTAPRERAGAASALAETSSEFGGALGIAVLGSIGPRCIEARSPSASPTRFHRRLRQPPPTPSGAR